MDWLDSVKLVIVRGLPGSGKSTLAKEIASACGFLHLENDQFLMVDGKYTYDIEKWNQAQSWCLAQAEAALASGRRVVVSNVFKTLGAMNQYRALTDSVVVVECTGSYGNVHDVPDAVVESMRATWEPFEGALRV